MMEIGVFTRLRIFRKTAVGLFLGDAEDNEVLLPNKYVTDQMQIDDEISVFIYLDHEERPVATTLNPYITLHDYAYLKVNYINQFGAFLDWGLEKDLFAPFAEQAKRMEVDKRYLVYCFKDEKTNRLVATSKINKLLQEIPEGLQSGDQVDLVISHRTDLGVNMIVNKRFRGLVYTDEAASLRVRPGDKLTGYVRQIREDGKIDLALKPIGYAKISTEAGKLLSEIKANKGFLGLTDKSHPEDVKSVLNMSKKTFKQAVGQLYKQQLISITEEGLKLNQ